MSEVILCSAFAIFIIPTCCRSLSQRLSVCNVLLLSKTAAISSATSLVTL